MDMEVNEFSWFDTHPNDDPFLDAQSLQWKDEACDRLRRAIEEYLSFETTRNLIKFVAECL